MKNSYKLVLLGFSVKFFSVKSKNTQEILHMATLPMNNFMKPQKFMNTVS